MTQNTNPQNTPAKTDPNEPRTTHTSPPSGGTEGWFTRRGAIRAARQGSPIHTLAVILIIIVIIKQIIASLDW